MYKGWFRYFRSSLPDSLLKMKAPAGSENRLVFNPVGNAG